MSEPPTVPILLVDDTRANLVAFDAVLSCDAYEIVAVPSGEEAIREVARRDFAVVLLDVQMPTMDGFETAQRMRDVVGRRRPVPIVFVSGIDCEPARVLRAYAGGGVDFIQKPFHPDVLRAKVAIFAELHRARARVVAQQAVTDRALHGLTELALALSETRTGTEVADVIVDRSMALARADAGFLYLLDDAGDALELIGQQGIAQDVADAYRRLTPDIAPSAFGIVRAPAIVWAETAGECEKLFPRFVGPETPREGPRAFWSMPLLAEGRAVGLLGMGFHVERSFDPEERSLVATLGKQCAQALLRAVRLDGEERAKAWLSTTLRSIGDAVIAADEAGRVRFMNPAAEQLTGWTESEARGCALANVFSVTLHASLPNGALLRSRTGAEIPVAHTAAPIEDDRGGLRGTVLVFRDVTAEANDRERSQAKRQELERVNRAKDEFLATMSHELRTPLNAITGWAAILRRKPRDPAKLERGLEVIERNALTQSRLVSDLLDVSRIISGKLQLSMRTIRVAHIVHAAADVVRSAADAKRVRLLVDVDPAIGESVADPDRLQQILWNLLTNAVRFTPAGGRVLISAERAHSAIEIRVQDTGAGIAGEHLPHIFERFRQVDSSTTRAHGGLGLGLSIVRHLVEAHGGVVDVHSDGLGKGTTFTVVLPIRAVSPREDPAPDARPTVREEVPCASVSDEKVQDVRVLVVDDERDSLEVVRVLLEGAGARVVTATSAHEALQALDVGGPFEVIISDIGMPEVDGYTFLRRVRSRAAGADVPAIALTAYARAEDAEGARRAGFQQHLAKPVDQDRLIEAVKTWSQVRTAERADAVN